MENLQDRPRHQSEVWAFEKFSRRLVGGVGWGYEGGFKGLQEMQFRGQQLAPPFPSPSLLTPPPLV